MVRAEGAYELGVELGVCLNAIRDNARLTGGDCDLGEHLVERSGSEGMNVLDIALMAHAGQGLRHFAVQAVVLLERLARDRQNAYDVHRCDAGMATPPHQAASLPCSLSEFM